MISAYRKRFIISVVVMVGIALMITFLVLSYGIWRNEYNTLQNTMSIVVRPWDSPGEGFRVLGRDGLQRPGGEGFGQRPDGMTPPDGVQPLDRKWDRSGWEQTGQDDLSNEIATVFYNSYSDEISVLSEDSFADAIDISSAVKEIAGLDKSFGTLRSYGLIYYKEGGDYGLRIALASTSYIRSKMASSILMLSLAYAAAMVLVLLISIKLSKTASKPMEDAVEMERQFVADISHDLKTPITVVMANSSILKDSADSTVAEQMQWIESTDEAAKSMLTMVTEMLDLSSLESEGRTAKKEPVDLSSAAEKCELQMESVAFERGVSLEADITEDVTASTDKELVQRIFSGLIENALKYEPAGGEVKVTLAKERKKAVFTVANSGSTIAEEDLPHIFERFYRGDKARSDKKGYGLGLPIIKAMTDLIGARISAASSLEDGTSFAVEFDL